MDEIKTIQNILLKDMQKVDKFLSENNIKYFIFFGTLIGAIRHQGFIPWDDDIDIAMLPEDYKKFRNIFSIDGYELHNRENNKDYNLLFDKVVGETEIKIDANSNLVINKLFIDVFPLYYYPKDCFNRIKTLYYLTACKYLNLFIVFSNEYYKDKFLYHVSKLFLKLYSKENIRKKIIEYDNFVLNNKESNELIDPSWSKFKVYKIDNFEAITHKFNDNLFKVPSGYDSLLRQQYGDYMKIPDESKRYNHSFKIKE